MPRAREEDGNPHAPFQRTDSTDTTPLVTYYEDAGERWFREDGRFWFEDKATGERTELVPGNPPENEPLPGEFFEAFGRLLGHVVKRKAQLS